MICVRLSSEAVDLSNLLNLRETHTTRLSFSTQIYTDLERFFYLLYLLNLREAFAGGVGYSWGTPGLGVQWNSDKQRHLVACSY